MAPQGQIKVETKGISSAKISREREIPSPAPADGTQFRNKLGGDLFG